MIILKNYGDTFFKHIGIGEAFYWGGDLFIKLQPCEDLNGITAVCLKDGHSYLMSDHDIVQAAHVHIEEDKPEVMV